MKARKARSTRLREKAVITIQAWVRGFLVRRAVQRSKGCGLLLSTRVCASGGHDRTISLSGAGIELYDAFGLQMWDSVPRRTTRSSIVVYEEPIELSSKRPLQLLEYEEDDSRHFVYYDELNRSNSRIRGRGNTPQRTRRHSPYDSIWNKRILQDFYNVKVPVSTVLVKKTASRVMLDTAGTPLTQIKHRIKRSHSTSTKNSSDDGERRRLGRPRSRVLDAIEPLTASKLRYQTPKQKQTPSRRRLS